MHYPRSRKSLQKLRLDALIAAKEHGKDSSRILPAHGMLHMLKISRTHPGRQPQQPVMPATFLLLQPQAVLIRRHPGMDALGKISHLPVHPARIAIIMQSTHRPRYGNPVTSPASYAILRLGYIPCIHTCHAVLSRFPLSISQGTAIGIQNQPAADLLLPLTGRQLLRLHHIAKLQPAIILKDHLRSFRQHP